MKLKFFPIILGLFIYFFVQNAVGQDFSVKKKYRDWAVYSSSSNECFLASKAKRTASYFNSREVLGKNRQNSFIYLSVNKNNTDYSMSYFSDYPLKINISGSMNIDNRKVFGLMALSSNKNSKDKSFEFVLDMLSDIVSIFTLFLFNFSGLLHSCVKKSSAKSKDSFLAVLFSGTVFWSSL